MARVIRERFERALRFIIAVHVPIAGLALLPLLLGGLSFFFLCISSFWNWSSIRLARWPLMQSPHPNI